MKKIFGKIACLLVFLIASNVEKAEARFFSVSDTIKVAPADTSTWVLTKLIGNKNKQHAGNKVFITINKSDKKISGYTSCNFVKAKFALQDSTIKISEVVVGKRECDEVTKEMETYFVGALQKVTTWKLEKNLLYLYENGKLVMEFKAVGKK